IRAAKNKTEQQRKVEAGDKTGIFTGVFAVNPVNGAKIPIWIADYVLSNVGTGAVMGVPAHDERDFDFAKKFGLELIQVVSYDDKKLDAQVREGKVAVEADGVLVNSGQFDGKHAWGDGKETMAEWMCKQGYAEWQTTYHLRDWLISRQRFWGPPIPMVECKTCGWQPVPEDQLPVELPYIEDYKPIGDGMSPLEKAPENWRKTTCPKCHEVAVRETDVSDTFLDSSWYFLRYPSLHTKTASTKPFDPAITKKWMPVNAYIGGAEHAVLHLLYSRFVTMAMKDWGLLEFEEPFPFLFGHGLIIKDGAKMSKSKGNVVNPDEYIDKFGADTLRTYLMFLGPYDQGGDFRDTGIAGMYRWMQKIWRLFQEKVSQDQSSTTVIRVKLHKTIKKCTADMSHFKFNTCIAALMECANTWSEEQERMSKADAGLFLRLLAPFAPYMTEELFQANFAKKKDEFQSIHLQLWPEYDESLVFEDVVEIAVQINGKVRQTISVSVADSKNKDILEKKALSDPKIGLLLSGKKTEKIIAVPGRLVNIVAS
ncbi:MAG TPA: class I tRNA ligase family protein, partial [Patescibacteria group bacterium]|nr:class I tRNA ligase family protein [Patescibacteria group bacterium]